jgi:hypothetical protein
MLALTLSQGDVKIEINPNLVFVLKKPEDNTSQVGCIIMSSGGAVVTVKESIDQVRSMMTKTHTNICTEYRSTSTTEKL